MFIQTETRSVPKLHPGRSLAVRAMNLGRQNHGPLYGTSAYRGTK